MVEKGEHFMEPPVWLEGFSLELIVELDDLVRRLGAIDPQGRMRRVSADPPERLFVSSVLNEEYRAVMISAANCGVIGRSLDDIYLSQFDDGNSYFMWERGITVGQVGRLVERLKSLAEELDAAGATGQLLGDNFAALQYPVDEVFVRRGLVKLPMGPVAPEQLMEAFDRPDELAAVETLRGRGICRKRDLWYVRLRERVACRILRKLVESGRLDPDNPPKGILDRVYAAAGAEIDKAHTE